MDENMNNCKKYLGFPPFNELYSNMIDQVFSQDKITPESLQELETLLN